MNSLREKPLLVLGVPFVLSAAFLALDLAIHMLTGTEWPDSTHLIMAGALLIVSAAVLSIHQRNLRERSEARALLAAQEASYRRLFDQFPEPTTVWSGDGVLLMQNLVSARNMGGDRMDYLGKTILEMFGLEAGAGYLERIQRVFRTGVAEEQADTVVLPDGDERYFWTVMQRVQATDGRDAVQVISYDNTERIRAEQAWRAEHDRASTYLNVAGVLFVALDTDGLVTLVNAKTCQMLGMSEPEIVGKDWIGTFVPERLRQQVRVDVQRMIAGGFALDDVYENPIITAAGEERLIAWHGVLLRNDQGQVSGILSSGDDITERRRAEEALRASEAQRIHERSALEERQRLARELHDSVSQALYGIALGVNTALTVLDRDREGARDALNYTIGLARAGLSEMRALIFELRPESLESEGLNAALAKQAEAIRARFEIPVALELCSEPTLPLAAKEALYRIAQEALHNAVKHAQATSLVLRVSCSPGCLTLTVQDDGVGFDPDALHPGHLGLKSMRERAASIGGSFEVNSEAGRGTRVEVQAPLGTMDQP